MEDKKYLDIIRKLLNISFISSVLIHIFMFLFNMNLITGLYTLSALIIKSILYIVLIKKYKIFSEYCEIEDDFLFINVSIFFIIEAVVYPNLFMTSLSYVLPFLLYSLKSKKGKVRIDIIVILTGSILGIIIGYFVDIYHHDYIPNVIILLSNFLQLNMVITIFGEESKIIHKKTEFLIDKSKRDFDTGLFHKAAFIEHVNERVQMMAPFTIAIITIDNYRKLNELYGETFCDAIYKRLIGVLKDNLPKDTLLHHFDIAHIAIILPKTTELKSYKYLETIRKIYSNESYDFNTEWAVTRRNITMSAGIVENNKRGTIAHGLIEKCIQALNSSIQSGKNKVTMYRENDLEWEDKFDDDRKSSSITREGLNKF